MRRVRRAGDNAVIIDCGTLDNALRTFEQLRDLRADEIVPAAETVLVIGADESALLSLLDAPIHTPPTFTPVHSGTSVTIPVVYDGADIQDVSDLTGLSPDALIDRHTSTEYTVAFTGFAPGFAYLTGGDGALDVPRRSSPRQRIPAGSVGLAGEFSGVYPRESPGGWQLIGRTSHQMWDLSRPEPATLIPGYSVRFEATRDAVTLGSREQENTTESVHQRTHVLTITNPGIQTLIEDLGRPGHAHQGVSPSGAADRTALREANLLVGNDAGAAALEISLGDFDASVTTTAVVAVCGAERNGVVVGKRKIPHGRAFRVDAGDDIHLPSPERGLRTVLAIRGGIDVPETLGSRSTDTLSGLGPETPTEIHVLPGARGITGNPAAPLQLPAAGEVTEFRVIPGPRDDWFEPGQFDREWEVTPASSRVGIRLSGTPCERLPGYTDCELPSEGLVTGAIQVPANGQPVLFLADRPLTGGYPVIGVVVEEDLDLAAQLPPGALVRFVPIDSEPLREGDSR
ncbi:5-oxoprolinase/urea amidolyase family protein [Corynebacterium sputi]|uniref:5-oxoprolinase subunit B/C family protein n=1 Tax=Corynebacterium sputi TaxID=489915 RepID=UPI0004141C04|nr:5-oxoprolinase/urea amidolyase family protein [Corynebacterium sputi]